MIADDATDSLQLFECLAEDPFGSVHFGVEWQKGRKAKEVLVRRYGDAWFDHGMLARLSDVRRNLVHLGHIKAFQGCHLSVDGTIQLVWPFARGHSLAQVLQTSTEQGIPFGIDQALTLIWALAHHIRKLHQARLPLGFLTPHRIWIGFDGWVQLLDVPTIEVLRDLLPKVPQARAAVEAYLGGPIQEGVAHDSFQLGALLYEMLTLQPLPQRWDTRLALESVTVRDLDGVQGPLPAPLMILLRRLLGLSEPFADLEDLERTLEISLFEGDFNPTTFGLAFAMQTLFRHEPEHLAADREEALQLAASPLPAPVIPAPPRRSPLIWAGAALLLALAGGGAWLARGVTARTVPSLAVPVLTTASSTQASVTPVPPPLRVSTPAPPPTAAIPPKPEPQPEPEPRPEPKLESKPEPKVETRPVRMRVFVDEQGKARQVRVLDSISEDSELGRKASLLAMAKAYKPMLEGGLPVRGWIEVSLAVK